MGFYAEPWLREARDHIKSVPARSGSTTSQTGDLDKLADAVEKAIKAAIIENSGRMPQQLENQSLVSICQTTGVWDVLPPALKGLVQEVSSLRSASASLSQRLTSGHSSAQLQRYFQIARGLIDYMEFHVIGNDSVLKRLKVA
jgi:predicted Zn-dependent protease